MNRRFKYKRGDLLERWFNDASGKYVDIYLVIACKSDMPHWSGKRYSIRDEYELFDIEAQAPILTNKKFVDNPVLVNDCGKLYGYAHNGWRKVSREK